MRRFRTRPFTFLAGLVLAGGGAACGPDGETALSDEQAAAGQQVDADPALAGAVDVHTHPAPDSRDRPVDAITYAEAVVEHGMAGFVLKQHDDHTAGLAYLVRRAVPGVEAFGTLVLNRSMGGVNVEAVERFAAYTGGWGRIVSMPTFDAARVPVSENGELLPEVRDVIATVAETRTLDGDAPLALATGHATPEESLAMIRLAQEHGLDRIMVTHPMGGWTTAQMQEAAEMGALLEFVAAHVIVEDAETRLRENAEAIRAVGPESVMISSDLGRADLPPLHPNALVAFADGLRGHGFSEEELALMLRDNPAYLVGLSASRASDVGTR